jgi:hypothetical protein
MPSIQCMKSLVGTRFGNKKLCVSVCLWRRKKESTKFNEASTLNTMKELIVGGAIGKAARGNHIHFTSRSAEDGGKGRRGGQAGARLVKQAEDIVSFGSCSPVTMRVARILRPCMTSLTRYV